MSDYESFLTRKRRVWTGEGVTSGDLPPQLFPWQAAIVRWALKKGRAAIFADCGLGKSFMQVAWANALGVRTLFLAPLCVAEQTVAEAAKLGITIRYARNEDEASDSMLVITNYERLDSFAMSGFDAVVLDESSILKAFDGKTRGRLIAACSRVKYRLCCTATPSPNDIAELANHAEFLGLTTWAEFMASWFIHDDAGWRMKKHAVTPFYRWLASWAVALRSPSDIGFSDDGFTLPPLEIKDHNIESNMPVVGSLFPEMGGKGLSGRLSARRGSMEDRVQVVESLVVDDDSQWLIWCGLNPEADAVCQRIEGAVQVSGSDSYAEKVAAIEGFVAGRIRVLVSKVRIIGYGMNFQNCHNVVFLGLGDSYEQYYQAIRRCWRFGQKSPVTAHVIVSEAERAVVENVRRKEVAARSLSDQLLAHMVEFEREEIAS
jgi:superfamily II DNA or RNA helicase